MAVGEWDQRQLCPDGGCVGVIGPDGTCKTCGRVAPNWGDERNRGLLDPPSDAEDEDEDEPAADQDDEYEDEDEGEDDEAPPRAAGSVDPAGDWGGRELCPDGACIGVIGPDHRCKVCGRSAAPELAPAGDLAAAPRDQEPER